LKGIAAATGDVCLLMVPILHLNIKIINIRSWSRKLYTTLLFKNKPKYILVIISIILHLVILRYFWKKLFLRKG